MSPLIYGLESRFVLTIELLIIADCNRYDYDIVEKVVPKIY